MVLSFMLSAKIDVKELPSHLGGQLLFYMLFFIVIFFLGVLYQLFIKGIQKRVINKRNVIYNALITGCLGLLVVIGGTFFYENNIGGVKDVILQPINQHERSLANKKSRVDKTEVTTIKKMVMRNAVKGLKKQGFVAIPSQNILLPIYNDAYSDKGLNAGANYANHSEIDPTGEDEPVMGKGNYGLAAHNFNDGRTGFSALQQSINHDNPYLVNGKLKGSSWMNDTTVLMANEHGIYRYMVMGQETVESSQVAILNPTVQPELTIISCLFPSTQYRIITHAHLVKSYAWQEAPKSDISEFNLKIRSTNARVNWWNPGIEEGVNGDAGGTK
ncbi:class A sortase [Leuconostoc carnosum]|uniref:class A sortase n=1 Tax=Leuconostoc carnosum TaxID=1252 RepID=UPI00345DD250